MSFENVPEECPDCGARYREYKLGTRHVNGLANERVLYACSKVLKYVPNFKDTKEVYNCRFSEEFKERRRKRLKVCGQLVKFLEDMDVDAEFRKEIAETLSELVVK